MLITLWLDALNVIRAAWTVADLGLKVVSVVLMIPFLNLIPASVSLSVLAAMAIL